MQALFRLLTFNWLLHGVHFLNAQTVNPKYKKLLEKLYQKIVPLITVTEAAKWQATEPELIFWIPARKSSM
ncbi:hypothetical protein AAE02nite_16690 [Adhaeribacter aerolatus]|uniref:Uncharacterized protein n=1 Tax=Adhaeribacter aerolatus TaxID=670289 RepID=A0A512AWB5_9BACT|nr:hypothetical protein AAE02nite_16690 [Adhaeribacter aerolatus]